METTTRTWRWKKTKPLKVRAVGRHRKKPEQTARRKMDMFTREQVAQMCHENNRMIQHAVNNANPSPAWHDAPEWQRTSALNGVDAVLAGETPPQLHESWCEEKRAAGWVFGHEKDENTRTHPCLVPYNYLPRSERVKDEVFHALVNAMRPYITTGS